MCAHYSEAVIDFNGGSCDRLEHRVCPARLRLSTLARAQRATVNYTDSEIRYRIANLVESVQDDKSRSQELFHYVWTMMCVKQGLMRVVREDRCHGTLRIVLEEIKTGRQRIVSRPRDMDDDVEGLAVQALARILGSIRLGS